MWRQLRDLQGSGTASDRVNLNGDGYWVERPRRWLEGRLPVDFPHSLYLPDSHTPGYPYPLICYLHADGSSERSLWNWFPKISDQNFIGLGVRAPFPAANGFPGEYRWLPDRPRASSAAILDAVIQTAGDWNIHPRRIFLMGEGSGAVAALQHLILQGDAVDGKPRISGVICRSLAEDWPARLPEIEGTLEGRALFLDPVQSARQLQVLDRLDEAGLEISGADEWERPPAAAINYWLMSSISTTVC